MNTSYYASYGGNGTFNGNYSNSQSLIAIGGNTYSPIPSKPQIPLDSMVPKSLDYKKLSSAIKSVAKYKLVAKNTPLNHWNALHIALNNAKTMNKARNANTQNQIDLLSKALIKAKSKLAKHNVT